MEEYRCKFCHRLLAKGKIESGYIGIKCPKCGELNTFSNQQEK
jgi:phage FluMu protein Com